MNECPQANELSRLLANPGDVIAWELLEQHLASCIDCRQRLDALADADSLIKHGNGTWRSQSSSSLALQQVIEKLQASPDKGAAAASPLTANAILAFLQPTEAPGFLGRLGIYEIRRVIGQGGMGIVLEALDPLLKRTVAIKILSPWRVLDEETKARFLREAQAAAAITHENVVAIHAVEEVDGLPFLVLEYVAGESLDGRLRRDGALPIAEVARLGAELARGLAAAHVKSLIHRDIKPANILLVEDTERAKIADFGLAKMWGEDALTMTGTLLGTPEFMSPEQAQGQEPDERSDLFSLGAVLYVVATAVSPFRGASLLDTLDNVRHCQPRPLREIDASLPDWFCDLVHRLLAKDPAARIGWASAVAALFEQASTGQSVIDFRANQATVKTSALTSASPWHSRQKWLLTAGALLTLAAFSAIGLSIWNRNSSGTAQPLAAGPALAPQLRDEPVIPPGFRIVGQDEHYAGLAAAIAAAQDGQTIEVYGNGPFLTSPITIKGKRLTIRAAAGAHPVLMENLGGRSNQPMLHSDTDLRLEGLEIHWSIELISGLSEAELLARSIIVTTHGRLLVAHCRIVSDRMNGCLAGSCRTVLIRHSHLVSKGMGVFWRPEAGGRLDIEGSVLENHFGISVLVDGVASGTTPGQFRLARSTLAAEYGMQFFLESPTRLPLPFAADHSLFDCEHLLFLLIQRQPRGKAAAKLAAKLEDVPDVLRNWIAWSEASNVYRRGVKYVSRAAPLAQGSVRSADIADAQGWLEFWQLPAAQSIDGDIRFQARPGSSKTAPLILDSIDNCSGPLPAEIGARAGELGPGLAYHAWRSSPEYATWPPAADRK